MSGEDERDVDVTSGSPTPATPPQGSPSHPLAARLTRRRLLIGGGAMVGAGALAAGGVALAGTVETAAPVPQRVPAPPGPSRGTQAAVTVEWVRSVARNRSVRLVITSPPGRDRATLPLCVGLHGLGGNALWWGDPGMRKVLGAAWASGVPPFAVAALDGGDNYWHQFRPGDDPMRMLLDELPAWMMQRGVARDTQGVPVLASGVSMGGAGALMYARARVLRGSPVRAVAAMSPGLFTDWRVASKRPFAGIGDWEANDPLRFYPELATTPTGMWCGDRDSFVAPVRRYIDLAHPQFSRITPGKHDGTYIGSVLPQVAAFLGQHVAPPALPFGLPSQQAFPHI
ncbi:alpha/beta hydrolase [Actinomycetospora endophytica]|uniref:Acyl-CoA:diacylglycerol acyltransferase n=1 Tax=Actinomycetospora endophytica TaxID=2291215 RepID=A0ABS8PM37_9PSEU|nr:alpha/beta hydrolase-fold protein [Actinomycetospora endophytica]MCD2198039.1 alpha/beta hydrolase [Actinomycetospora endophytica]